ncbi:hypothetical protein BCV70DRAFT_208609 [Testicularia cyperi]|uniref:Uncharacterized protein n=1 Tax=Testicularia cyperi TaxID=1882483 RepID=A0A317XI05_9BASI|nr:hypothetical protein BCV70DRAFT_208609 [Testicularia cyperi]
MWTETIVAACVLHRRSGMVSSPTGKPVPRPLPRQSMLAATPKILCSSERKACFFATSPHLCCSGLDHVADTSYRLARLVVNSQVNAIATQTRDWQTPWNDYFLPLITYRWGDYEFLQLPRLFSHQPAGEDLLATVQDWTSSLVRYHVSFKQLRPDVLEDLQSWMFDYFHREHRTSRVFTLISQRENGRNYLVTHHKNSRWTKNAHRATFIAVWSARNTEMGVQLVLHGLVSSGWDWTRFGHPLFLAYERVPEVNGLFKIYAPALPDTSSSLTPSNSPALPFYSV